MSNSALVIAAIIVTIVAVAGIAYVVRKQRTQRLRTRFGPEYQRALQETGSTTQAEAKLEKRLAVAARSLGCPSPQTAAMFFTMNSTTTAATSCSSRTSARMIHH